MKRKTKLAALIWTVPFVMGATLEFLPAWVKWPAFLSLGILYIGACFELSTEIDKEKTQGEGK